jgi:hypothetical protein
MQKPLEKTFVSHRDSHRVGFKNQTYLPHFVIAHAAYLSIWEEKFPFAKHRFDWANELSTESESEM